MRYSKTSNSGPFEIGTVYNGPLYKGHCLRFQIFTLPIDIYNLREEDNLSTKDETTEFILFPMCPLFRGSTVYEIGLVPTIKFSDMSGCTVSLR